MIGPAHQQRLQHARDRALADGDAARDPDDVRHARVQVAEERLGHGVEVTGRREPQVQQPRQRQVDVFDLLERDRLVPAAQEEEVRFVERERRRRAQSTPLLAGEVDVRGDVRFFVGVHREVRTVLPGPQCTGSGGGSSFRTLR